jgi:hypothetical protein
MIYHQDQTTGKDLTLVKHYIDVAAVAGIPFSLIHKDIHNIAGYATDFYPILGVIWLTIRIYQTGFHKSIFKKIMDIIYK